VRQECDPLDRFSLLPGHAVPIFGDLQADTFVHLFGVSFFA